MASLMSVAGAIGGAEPNFGKGEASRPGGLRAGLVGVAPTHPRQKHQPLIGST